MYSHTTCIHQESVTRGVIDLTLPHLPEEECLPVRSICLNLFQKTLYRIPPLFAEDGRGLPIQLTFQNGSQQKHGTDTVTGNDYVVILIET